MDKIQINNLVLDCIIGVYDDERRLKQNVVVNVIMWTDTKTGGQTDDIKDCINYKTHYDDITGLVENSQFHLIEALAEAVAGKCLEDKLVKKVLVSIEKPGALKKAQSASVEIVRENEI